MGPRGPEGGPPVLVVPALTTRKNGRRPAARAIRRGEVDAMAEDFERAGVPVAGRLDDPAWAEGGDCCWLDERTLLVGCDDGMIREYNLASAAVASTPIR